MKESIKVSLEQRHNVTIDAEAEMFCVGDVGQTYGWSLIPDAWIDGLLCIVTGCGKIVDNEGDYVCGYCCRC